MFKTGPNCSLQVRILFHIAHKKKDEKALMQYLERLCESMEDQLSLASFHYLQGNYQDATDIYKRVLLEHRDWLALNVYVALCYYNLDFHDVSLEILNAYLQAYPDSAMAANFKVIIILTLALLCVSSKFTILEVDVQSKACMQLNKVDNLCWL
ncbi:hypothetical protein L7F22_054262 [Adiantum nelumboides]|nr:hypothetical protein [Adiantum nelumboides]